MCSKCSEYDEKIARLRRLSRDVADDRFAKTAQTMVTELIAERAKFRCTDRNQQE